MNHYKHLTTKEQEDILFLIAKGISITKIAEQLGRNKSTIGLMKERLIYILRRCAISDTRGKERAQ